MISQIIIGVFGVTAIWMVGRKEKWRKYGYVLGLMAQPFWFVWTIRNDAWGIFVLTIFYAYSWGQGVYNHMIKK